MIARGLRMLLQRDVGLPDGGSLDLISLTGPNTIAPLQRNISVAGVSGETLGYSMSYLTTPACVVNLLYGGNTGPTIAALGVPDSVQRATDFHMITVNATSGVRVRSISQVFQAHLGRVVTLPPISPAPIVRDASGSYRRLEATLGIVPVAYNGAATFRYEDGLRTVTVQATSAYTTGQTNVLTMPDFSGVSGWLDSYAPAVAARGTWTVTVDGQSTEAPLCTEGRTTYRMVVSGTY